MTKKIILLLFFLNTFYFGNSQNISLYEQFNGRYDFTFVGNTLNPNENGAFFPNFILTSSSATLNLQPDDEIERAYLYWAGCGPGDFNVKLNDIDISASRTFSTIQASSGKVFFSAFYDVTTLVQTQGNGTYTLSELDVNDQIPNYWNNGTHFAGWAIAVVYRNNTLPLNVINIYDGLESLSTQIAVINGVTTLIDGELNITISNLNVIDDIGSKIGFIAWEGDRSIAVRESLSINGNIVESLPLNPANNAFNGTNTVTGSTLLHNMDLDIYDIQNFIAIGDDEAVIRLTTGQDYVMINTIITKLNSQLPDATIVLDEYTAICNSRNINLNYTVFNLNSTEILPANTPITFYIDGNPISTTFTLNEIPIDGSESNSITLTIPNNFGLNFTLLAVVDDSGNGTGIVTELIESNNTFEIEIDLNVSPDFNILPSIRNCNLGLTRGIFDFSTYEELVKTNSLHEVSFHENWDDANQNINPIFNPSNYEAITTPKEIYVRIDNGGCYAITQFLLETYNCPPTVYNAVSANNDGMNDGFFIAGLRDVFINFELLIFNRWGKHLWTGNNNKPDWDGYVSEGVGSKQAPEGTYYYILYLNDPDYTEPLTGYLYLTR
jgi:gliding motility-associated-like protein